MKIKIVGLSGCARCSDIKERFELAGIMFDWTTCEQNPQHCDNLEALINSTIYPVVLITSSKNEILQVLYFPENYSDLARGNRSEGTIEIIPVHLVDQMLDFVKKRLNWNK